MSSLSWWTDDESNDDDNDLSLRTSERSKTRKRSVDEQTIGRKRNVSNATFQRWMSKDGRRFKRPIQTMKEEDTREEQANILFSGQSNNTITKCSKGIYVHFAFFHGNEYENNKFLIPSNFWWEIESRLASLIYLVRRSRKNSQDCLRVSEVFFFVSHFS